MRPFFCLKISTQKPPEWKSFVSLQKFKTVKYMNKELITQKRSLKNNVSFNDCVLEGELKNSVSPEEFRAKLLDSVAKQYENLQD